MRQDDGTFEIGANMRNLWVALCVVLLVAACGEDDEPAEPAAAPQESTTTMDAHDHDHGQAAADCSPSGTSLAIVAKDTAFDKNCLAAPANSEFSVTLDNQDSKPHNLVLLESHTATDVFGRIEIINGPKSGTMKFAGQPPGTYAFHCEVHPNRMSGTFVVK